MKSNTFALMKKLSKLLLMAGILLLLSSCFVTKKKCDCPKFGKQQTKTGFHSS